MTMIKKHLDKVGLTIATVLMSIPMASAQTDFDAIRYPNNIEQADSVFPGAKQN